MHVPRLTRRRALRSRGPTYPLMRGNYERFVLLLGSALRLARGSLKTGGSSAAVCCSELGIVRVSLSLSLLAIHFIPLTSRGVVGDSSTLVLL